MPPTIPMPPVGAALRCSRCGHRRRFGVQPPRRWRYATAQDRRARDVARRYDPGALDDRLDDLWAAG